MLNLIDPDFEDQRIAAVRKALSIGSPSYVSLNMRFGLLDLRVEIESVVNTVIDIRGIELSKIINAQTGDLKKLLAKIPIQ